MSAIASPLLDRLIDEASAALTEEERKVKYGRAQQLIAEDAPYIPIWNRVNAIVAQPGLSGLHLGLTGDFQSLREVRWSGAQAPSEGQADCADAPDPVGGS